MVKGIDAQHLVTQTYVAEKVQQVQQRQADIQQRYFDVQLAQERKKLQEKIQHAEDSEKMKLHERRDHQEKEKGGEEKRHFHEDEGDEEKHLIDLKA